MGAGGFAHTPVLAAEVMQHLAPVPGGTYCDGTLGGAGHSSLIAEAIGPAGHLIGIDRDLVAHEAARARLANVPCKVTLLHGTFGDVAQLLADANIASVDGFLLDVGVSSPQLDTPERGFSFMTEGPIDMRMDPTSGITALELIEQASEYELSNILRDYGEERYARRIAGLLKEAAAAGDLKTTLDVAKICVSAIPKKEQATSHIHAATRTFQGLRIAVNRELEQLERFLAVFPRLLKAGGRCAIISFHSLEDRLVKNAFRDLAWSSSMPAKYAQDMGERIIPVCTLVTSKAVFGGDAETAVNPRARSARLRVCQRTDGPMVDKVVAPHVSPVASIRTSKEKRA